MTRASDSLCATQPPRRAGGFAGRAAPRLPAVGFLHSYINPAHEKRVGELPGRELPGRELPGVAISLSHEVSPEMREYERLSTACANACVQPEGEARLHVLSGAVKYGTTVFEGICAYRNPTDGPRCSRRDSSLGALPEGLDHCRPLAQEAFLVVEVDAHPELARTGLDNGPQPGHAILHRACHREPLGQVVEEPELANQLPVQAVRLVVLIRMVTAPELEDGALELRWNMLAGDAEAAQVAPGRRE
jgi:hypothetical protein